MFYILAKILTLVQSKMISSDNTPENCVCCGRQRPWRHGTRPRKPDRENSSSKSLNPIMIQRYYCNGCKKTFSALPECISPRRWYTWEAQQQVLLLFILGDSAYSIATKCTPSYKTISRWIVRAKEQFKLHKDTLGAIDKYKSLIRTRDFNDFWKVCFEKITLAAAMRICHVSEVIIP
jgi:transposase-like protein